MMESALREKSNNNKAQWATSKKSMKLNQVKNKTNEIKQLNKKQITN